MEENKSKLEKTDKQIRDGMLTNLKVNKQYAKKFADYCGEQHISKLDALHSIISFLDETKMPLVALKIQNEMHFMRKYHDFTAGVLKNFESSFLTKLDKNNSDNIEFITKISTLLLEHKTKENIFSEQNFKLLRGLVSANIDEKDAKILLNETLKAVEEAQYSNSKKSNNTTLIIEGRVGASIQIDKSTKQNLFYIRTTLAEHVNNSDTATWHKIAIWEGVATSKLGLKESEKVKEYFETIKTGNLLKIQGYWQNVKIRNKEGVESIQKQFNVTEVLSHSHKKERK